MTPRPPPPRLSMPAADAQAEDASLLDEMSPLEYEALRWSVRVADGLDAPARQQFDAWLAADAAHRAAYADMAGIFDEVAALPAAGAAHLSARVVIDSVAASAAADPHVRHSAAPAVAAARPGAAKAPDMAADAAAAIDTATMSSSPSHAARRGWLRHALAGVAALAAGGAGWAGFDHWQRQPLFQQRYATARGQQMNADLPDGSRLQLDTATQADVTLYRDRREVQLVQGQAVFKVRGDQARSFDVLAGASRITVVGTRFSVRYLAAGMQVAVMEGKVRVAGGGDVRHLLPGQTISASQDGRLSEVANMPVDAMASWLGGRLSFDNVALSEVLAELARYGDTGLRLGDDAVGKLAVTASVNLRDPRGFARSLPRVLPVRLRVLPDGGTEIIARK